MRQGRGVVGVVERIGDADGFGPRAAGDQVAADVDHHRARRSAGERRVDGPVDDVALGERVEDDRRGIEMGRGARHRIEAPVRLPHQRHRRRHFRVGRQPLHRCGLLPHARHGFRRSVERAAGAIPPRIEQPEHVVELGRHRHRLAARPEPAAELAIGIVAAQDLRVAIDPIEDEGRRGIRRLVRRREHGQVHRRAEHVLVVKTERLRAMVEQNGGAGRHDQRRDSGELESHGQSWDEREMGLSRVRGRRRRSPRATGCRRRWRRASSARPAPPRFRRPTIRRRRPGRAR